MSLLNGLKLSLPWADGLSVLVVGITAVLVTRLFFFNLRPIVYRCMVMYCGKFDFFFPQEDGISYSYLVER